MKKIVTKISLFILIGIIYTACNSVKRVPNGKLLLTKNEITVDGKSAKGDILPGLLYQKPNSKILKVPFRLYLFNIAKQNPDSIYKADLINNPKKYKRQSQLLSAKQVKRKGESFLYSGIHKFLKKTGEVPVIIDQGRTEKSLGRIKSYFFNNGFFNAKVSYTIDTISKKKAKIKYNIALGTASIIDSLSTKILTPALDSLYSTTQNLSLIKKGENYKSEVLDNERNRITTNFRNNGAYYFQQSNIVFDIDTVDTKNKSNIKLIINNRSIRENDSTATVPFKLYKVSKVNIYTDTPKSNEDNTIKDSANYNDFNLYSYKKLRYKPRAITDAVFIGPGTTYSDIRTSLTNRYLSNLKVFNSPSITYKIDGNDSSGKALVANIFLTPRKKFSFGVSLDLTHSNIQDFGIALSPTLSIRNVFRGAEVLEISARGNIGSSKDLANPRDLFFNISEYGIDTRLNFPRILLPFGTEKIIPKRMIPSTVISLGFAKQQNIGLDKENFTGAMSYIWTPKRNNNARFDLFNIQYVNNINVANYYNVYRSSYNVLNNFGKIYNNNLSYFDNLNDRNLIIKDEIGTKGFTNDVLAQRTALRPSDDVFKAIRSIEERRKRLTENNLIVASNFTFSKTTRTGLLDNTFSIFKTKIESAGNLLSLFANASKSLETQNTKKTIFDLEYSQYIKTEFEYIKHFDLSREKVFAMRGFIGVAIPYGNSTTVPFSRSYFAGGTNDIRAWQPYSLGPGSSGAINDFNEANLKITTSAEFRFKILNSLKGALFVDAGNIWNVLDEVEDEASVFDGFRSLKNIAVGSGFGLRYDLNFFVIRVDTAFKTYIPSDEMTKRWFRDYNFGNAVLNIGINYPF